MASLNKVATHLMFSGNASAAMELYGSVFPEFRVERIERYRAGEPGPEATVKRADASLHGHALIFIDSPVTHAFTFTPAVSLFVDFETRDELESAFSTLSSSGQVFMPLGDYGFSKRFGWCADRFGVSWQLNLP
jgi:predicted 3-demethylubiquinone-9 3-methyltransferase (glyoxalase superfamily)